MSLSVVIITFNEERNIERCLKSVAGIADEILVVDSYSTDRTLAICSEYNARIIQQKFEGYGSQKQYATSKASYDYILSLDADEELSEELKQSISLVKENWACHFYSFNRLNFYCNKAIRHCGWYPDKQVRLFDRRSINWNSKKVHESIDTHNGELKLHLKGNLHHYTCSTIAEHQQKEKKYAQMNAEILISKGKKVSPITPYVKGAFRFFRTYIIKLGILDGYYGFMISKTVANSSFNKYFQARNRNKV